MALFPTWSRRKREASLRPLDPFTYDEFPRTLRIQIIHIFREIDAEANRVAKGMTDTAVKFLRQEFGEFQLVKGLFNNSAVELENLFFNESNIDRLLDAIEYIFTIAPYFRSEWGYYDRAKLERQIGELNARLLEAGVGYQFEAGRIIQVSDEFNYKEIVLPTLQLIAEKGYETVQREFLAGHTAFRLGDYETCLMECHKAFESVLKIIAKHRQWGTDEDANTNKLITAAFDSGFIPKFMQNELTSLRSMLESAIPAKRNKSAAHGAGNNPRQVSASLARFQMNQTAATIRFLADLHKES